jgi:hypothetical protein
MQFMMAWLAGVLEILLPVQSNPRKRAAANAPVAMNLRDPPSSGHPR